MGWEWPRMAENGPGPVADLSRTCRGPVAAWVGALLANNYSFWFFNNKMQQKVNSGGVLTENRIRQRINTFSIETETCLTKTFWIECGKLWMAEYCKCKKGHGFEQDTRGRVFTRNSSRASFSRLHRLLFQLTELNHFHRCHPLRRHNWSTGAVGRAPPDAMVHFWEEVRLQGKRWQETS